MQSLGDGLPPLTVRLSFPAVGSLEVYGLSSGMVGGGGKPASVRLCGSCPSWSRATNVAVCGIFLAIGLGCLANFAWTVFRHYAA